MHWQRIDEGGDDWAVVLRDDDSAEPLLALGFYTRAVAVGPGRLLVWHPRGDEIVVRVFAATELRPLSLDFGVLREHRVASSTPPVETIVIPDDLPAGANDGYPCRSAAIDELLLIADGPRGADPDIGPAASIYVWAPGSGKIDVLPQLWFTAQRLDLGYQWITKAVRDPRTGRIVCDGIRIAPFELNSDGTTIRRLLVP
jgi:hypothetical protein